MQAQTRKDTRFNIAVNVIDGTFFGFGLGVASYVTVIPLFVSTLTDSSVLIGLIAAMHMIGWQLPQLLTANYVARLRRFKPLVLLMTLNERVPFFLLTLVALLLPTLGRELGLILTFVLVTWQAMGGGLTGTAWQILIAKIIPLNLRGTFYGLQSAGANVLGSVGAVLAGVLLKAVDAPVSFALCFFIAGVAMMVSFGSLAVTREPDAPPAREKSRTRREFWQGLGTIIRGDGNLRLFIAARMVAQVASVGSAFFTIYAVRVHHMDVGTVGVMTGVLMLAQTVANPLFGWMGDRHSHRVIYAVGALLAGGSAAVALFAPSIEWFYVVFMLAGFAGAALWTTANALTVEFGPPSERPYYIGLTNTLIAPVTLAAPLIGGWLADTAGYGATFLVAAISAVITALLIAAVREPRQHYAHLTIPAAPVTEHGSI